MGQHPETRPEYDGPGFLVRHTQLLLAMISEPTQSTRGSTVTHTHIRNFETLGLASV